MKHLGDITKISGYDVPLVDFVVGGSPCQDLSVAGARKGLLHSELGDEETTRSGLFIEQIRIIREMRDAYKRRKGNAIGWADDDIRCVRYGMWENVYGAFSSNHGADFRVCLEEFARVAEQGISIPMPKDGKWKSAGAIIGNGWSIAWRTMDAQYWGVPQRRRRICLLADFDGYTAPDIVFEQVECGRGTVNSDRESSVGYPRTESESEIQSFITGLPRDIESCGEKRKEVTTDAKGSIGTGNRIIVDDFMNPPTYSVDMGGGKSACDIHEDKAPTPCTTRYGEPAVCFRKQSHPRNSEEGQGWEETDKNDTLNVYDNSENRTPTIVVYKGDEETGGDKTFCIAGDHENRPTDMTNLVIALDRASYNQGKNAKFDFKICEGGVQPTLTAMGPGAVCYEEEEKYERR